MRFAPCHAAIVVLSLYLSWDGRLTAAESGAAHIAVPEGFSVELVAGPQLVGHPVMAGFDDQGRLYVADNAGVNLPAVLQFEMSGYRQDLQLAALP